MFKKIFGRPVQKEEDEVQKDGLHPDAHAEGGMTCNNQELLKIQRQCITEWIKSMGKRVMSGQLNLINTPFPVKMFEARSFLEKLADPWVYPGYLTSAADTTDPVERMKLVIAWFLAGLHHGFETWRKPFNPILGETWQATLSDGSQIFMEQTSHHPPVSAFQILGPGGSYTFTGLSQPSVSLMLKAYGFKTVAKGYRRLEFKDGTVIDMVYPHYMMRGVVYSTSPRGEVVGTAVFTDKKNKLQAVLEFGPVKGSANAILRRSDAVVGHIFDTSSGEVQVETEADADVKSDSDSDDGEGGAQDDSVLEELKSMGIKDESERHASGEEASAMLSSGSTHSLGSAGGNDSQLKSSGSRYLSRFFKSTNTAAPPPGTILSKVEGSWVSYLSFDDQRYWTLTEQKPDVWQAIPDPLPSDSRYRQDLAHLASGDLEGAQHWKSELEELQRADKKARGVH